MNETTWLLCGFGAGWLLAMISTWIGIVIGCQWHPKEKYHVMRPWRKREEKNRVTIAPQTGSVKED